MLETSKVCYYAKEMRRLTSYGVLRSGELLRGPMLRMSSHSLEDGCL